jgi:hypothetical protein
MKSILFCNCCALFFFVQTPLYAQDARCTPEQIERMKNVLTPEEVSHICDTVQTTTVSLEQPLESFEHAGEPIPRLNWGALEDYFDIGELKIGSNRYKAELDIHYNALEFEVRATSKMGILGRLMLPHWHACFYDRDNIPMETRKVRFDPLYITYGWTAGMRGKGYIVLSEKIRLSDVGVIRIKRLPCD